MTQFTVGEAWSQSIAFLRDNMRILLIFAGGAVLLGTLIQVALSGAGASEGAQVAAMVEAFQSGDSSRLAQVAEAQRIWPSAMPGVILASLVPWAGSFAALRLGLGNGQDGMGSAVSYGLGAALLTLIAFTVGTAILFLIIFVPLMLLGVGTMAAGGSGLAILPLLLLAFIGVMMWLMIRLAVFAPAMAAERSMNPLYGIAQSWTLTRGHALPILGFYTLFGVIAIILTIVLGAVTATATMLLGAATGSVVASVLVSAPISMVSIAVQAGMFRTLSPDRSIGDVFG